MTRTAAVAVLILFSAVVSAQQEQASLTINGRISADSPNGPSIAGRVTVFMRHDGALVTDTTTANEGGFFTLDVPTQPYEMLVWAENYAPRIIGWPASEFALTRFQELRGQVFWEDEPVEGAFVHARHAEEDGKYLPDWMADSLEVQKTDAAGEFVIRDVIPYLPVVVRAQYLVDLFEGAALFLSDPTSIPANSKRSDKRIELHLKPAPGPEDVR